MDLSKSLSILRRYLWLIVLAPLVAGLTTLFVVGNQPTSYRAATRLLVGPSLDNPSPDINSLRIAGQLIQTYAELAQTRPFLESVNNKLEQKIAIESLGKMITTRQNIETRILNIIVYHPNPKRAVAIANAAAETFLEMSPSKDNTSALLHTQMSQQSNELEKIVTKSETTIQQLESELAELKSVRVQRSSNLERQALITRQLADERAHWADALRTLTTFYQVVLDTNTIQVEIIEPAGAVFPVNQDLPLKAAASGIAGLILAVMIAFAFDYFDGTIRIPQDFSRSTKVPLLSNIEKHNSLDGSGLERVVAFAQPQSRAANSYRMAVSKLLFSIGESIPYTFLLSSVGSQSGDDTATATMNLAVGFAQAGHRVVVVDAQFHNPVLTNLFKADHNAGLSDLLIANSPELQLISVEQMPGVRFLPAGLSSEQGSAAALNSVKIVKLVEELQKEADIVLVAAAPISWSAETLTLASQVKGVILVTRQGEARTKIVTGVIESLMDMNVQIAGIIFDDNPSPFMSKPRRKILSAVTRDASKESTFRRDKRAVQVDLDTTQPPAVVVVPAGENTERAHLDQVDIEAPQPADVAAAPADENIEATRLEQVGIEAPQPLDVAAIPADENIEPTRLDQEDIDTIQTPDMRNLHLPTDEIEVSSLARVDVDPAQSPNLIGSITSAKEITSLEEVAVNPTHTPDLEDAAVPADEETELPNLGQVDVETILSTELADAATSLEKRALSHIAQVDIDAAQSPDLHPSAMLFEENVELALVDATVEKTKINDLKNSKGAPRANHKKRTKRS